MAMRECAGMIFTYHNRQLKDSPATKRLDAWVKELNWQRGESKRNATTVDKN